MGSVIHQPTPTLQGIFISAEGGTEEQLLRSSKSCPAGITRPGPRLAFRPTMLLSTASHVGSHVRPRFVCSITGAEHFTCFLVRVHECMPWHTCGGQRATWNQFSLPILMLPGTELRSSWSSNKYHSLSPKPSCWLPSLYIFIEAFFNTSSWDKNFKDSIIEM